MNYIDRHVWDSVWHAAGGDQLHHLPDKVHVHDEINFAAILQPNFSEKVG
jgi:hypothetical protein